MATMVKRRGILGLLASSSVLVPRTVRAFLGPAPTGRIKACVSVFLHGGPSQIDTWDPKPGRSTGGPFRAIATAISDVHVSEHLPHLATRAERLAIVRSVVGTEPSHDRAIHLMRTSYAPQRGTGYPPFFALFAREHRKALVPSSVAIGSQAYDPGLLGRAHAPLVVRETRNAASSFTPVIRVKPDRQERRLARWRAREDALAARLGAPELQARREIFEEALAMLEGDQNRLMFDISRESRATRDRYGKGSFGDSCLLARRLVEGGVPFVEVTQNGWDTHTDNFNRVERLSRALDQGLAALLDDLDSAGLLQHTLVVCMGEFGRTPKINAAAGRDHYPSVSSVVLAGAGIRTGQVLGATDVDGVAITERPVPMTDLLRTLAVTLGVDADEVHVTDKGRPFSTIDGGSLVAELMDG